MSRSVQVFFIALGSMIAIKTNTYFIKDLNIDPLISLVLAGGLAIITIQLLDYCVNITCKRISWIRRFIDPRAQFEGQFILRLNNLEERPYSLASVTYNPHSNNYIFSGYAFDADGNPKAFWKSQDINFDLKACEFRFSSDSKFTDPAKQGENIKNWGVVSFDKGPFGRRYTHGRGYFVDLGIGLFQATYFFDRITKKNTKELIGKKSIKSTNDMSKFVKAYHVQN